MLMLRGLLRSVFQTGFYAAVFLIPAGTWRWPRALQFLVFFGTLSLLMILALARWAPLSLEARVQRGAVKNQPAADKVASAVLGIYSPGNDRKDRLHRHLHHHRYREEPECPVDRAGREILVVIAQRGAKKMRAFRISRTTVPIRLKFGTYALYEILMWYICPHVRSRSAVRSNVCIYISPPLLRRIS